MTDLQDALDQIKARAEKATEGPWDYEADRVMQDGVYPAHVFAEHMVGYPVCDVDTMPIPAGDWDAEFIAHARTDVPHLLEAVEAVHDHARCALEQTANDSWDRGYDAACRKVLGILRGQLGADNERA